MENLVAGYPLYLRAKNVERTSTISPSFRARKRSDRDPESRNKIQAKKKTRNGNYQWARKIKDEFSFCGNL